MDMYQKRKERQENKKNETYDEKKTNINWYPGHMVKAKREIEENIKLIDIVFEVIDARIPLSSKNKDIDKLTKGKEKILIMTKVDLCDIDKTNIYKKQYEDMGYSVLLVDLINNINVNKIFDLVSLKTIELNKKRKEKGLKERRIRALVLGIPNVGKSTLINRLVKKKATNVGNKPGITKKLEWIRINDKIELLDTPGILWPKLDNQMIAYNLASMTAIKEEILDKQEVAFYIINKLLELYPSNLDTRYNLNDEKDNLKIVELIAKNRGMNITNEYYDKVYEIIINDLRNGYLGKVTFD